MIGFERQLGILALLALSACSGGGGGGGGSATPPSNLTYPRPSSALIVDVPAAPNTPTFLGSASTFTIQPALPAGMTLDVNTGSIGGLPSQARASTPYVVQASNSAGFTTTTIRIAVSPTPRFAYVTSQTDSTISILVEDAESGGLNHVGCVVSPGNQIGPGRVVVHPGGAFAYVPNMTTSNLSVYAIDASSGWLTPGTPLPLGSGPHSIAIDPAGAYLYATSQNSDRLQVFSINPSTGALTQVQLVSTGVQPSACAVDPRGDFLFVSLRGNPTTGAGSALQSYVIDAPTGSVTAPFPSASLNGSQPADLVVDPQGATVYTAGERFDFAIPLRYDPATGALTVLTARHTGDRPTGIAMDPTGRFVYTTNRTGNTVSCFVADPSTGDLTISGDVPTSADPVAVIADAGGRFLSVASAGARTLARFDIDEVSGTLVAGESITTRAMPVGIAIASGTSQVSLRPRFVHVVATDSNEVPAYTIAQATGTLTEVINPVLTDQRPVSVALDPRHRFLYVANEVSRTIEGFTINASTGALTSVGLSSVVEGTPTHVTVDPSGRFLYVTAHSRLQPNDGWVTRWTINPNDGSIDPMDTHQVTDVPLWVLCDPVGSFLYVASKPSGAGAARISVLEIDPSNGSLTLSANPPTAASGVSALGYHPKRRCLYAVLSTANAVVTFTADPATGELTVVPGGAGNSGLSPSSISLTPDGRFAYVSYLDPGGPGHVSHFSVDPATGKLVVPAVQYFDGLHPADLAVDGAGRFLYVANNGSNTVSVFGIDAATGDLTTLTAAASGLAPNAIVVTTITQ